MEYLYYQRLTRLEEGSIDASWYLAQDHRHFMHSHRKHYKAVWVLYEDSNLQVMFYQSKICHPFPFANSYVTCKHLNHEERSLQQIYIDISKPDDQIWLDVKLKQEGKTIVTCNTMRIPLKGIMKLMPNLMVRILDRRGDRMWQEDKVMLNARNKAKLFSNDECLPPANILVNDLYRNLEKITELSALFDGEEKNYMYKVLA